MAVKARRKETAIRYLKAVLVAVCALLIVGSDQDAQTLKEGFKGETRILKLER